MTYLDASMVPLKPRPEEEAEQALGVLWQLKEVDDPSQERARSEVAARVSGQAFQALLDRGLVRVQGGRFEFDGNGERLAADLTRRRRLAERLLADLLNIRGLSLESNACQWEHILSNEVTRSICVFLGHPRTCPHGQAIPEGDCCRSASVELEPLLAPLSALEPGSDGRVAYLAMPDPHLFHRLLSLGLVPGARVRLSRSSPAVVVQVEGNLLALESDLAASVFVRRL